MSVWKNVPLEKQPKQCYKILSEFNQKWHAEDVDAFFTRIKTFTHSSQNSNDIKKLFSLLSQTQLELTDSHYANSISKFFSTLLEKNEPSSTLKIEPKPSLNPSLAIDKLCCMVKTKAKIYQLFSSLESLRALKYFAKTKALSSKIELFKSVDFQNIFSKNDLEMLTFFHKKVNTLFL